MTDTAIPEATVVPKDKGISGDPEGERGTAYAAHLASLATQAGTDSYRGSGLKVTDNGDGTVSISPGLALLRYEGGVQTYDSTDQTFADWEHPVVFAVGVPADLDVAVDGDASNDVWLAVDLSDGQSSGVFVRHGSDVAAPAEPAMQLASVAADGTVTPVAPDGPVFDTIRATKTTTGELSVTDNFSNIQIAQNPDDLQRAVDTLPNGHGTILLVPGDYDDADWTTGITLPAEPTSAGITIDGMGSSVTLSSWDGTDFISKPEATQNSGTGPVNIQNISVDAYSVPAADLSNFVTLPDIDSSTLKYGASGEFDIGTYVYASGNAGSCHHNRTRIQHGYCDIGLKLGDQTKSLGIDRGEYRIQASRVGDAGCEVAYGGWNEIYAQTENARDDVSNGGVDGVRTRPLSGSFNAGGHDNEIKLIHRITGATNAISLNIQGPRNKVNTVGLGSTQAIDKAAISSRAGLINVPGFSTMKSSALGDMLSNYDVGATGGGTTPEQNGYGSVLLDAGTTAEDESYIQSRASFNPTRASSQFVRVLPVSNNGTLRFGWWNDESNYATLVMDESVSTITVNAVSNGTSISGFPIDTGIQTGVKRDLSVFGGVNENTDPRQYWFVDGERVATTYLDTKTQLNVSGGSGPPSRLGVESDGSASKFSASVYDVGIRDN